MDNPYRDETPMTGDYISNDIKTIAEAIRHKKHGVDTRDAMAQSLEKMGQLAMQSVTDPNSVAKQAYDIANNELSRRLAQMDNGVHAYPNADAIKQTYPNGKDGIFVAVDTGHQWYWVDGTWKDAGVYQSVGTGYIADVGTITPDWTSGLSLGNADGARKDSMYSLLGTSKNVINLPDGVSNASTNLLFTYGDKYPVQLFLSQNKIWKRETSNGNYTDWSLIVDMNKGLSLIENLTNADEMKSNSFYIGVSATDSVQGLPRITAQKHEYLIETYGKVESLSAVQRFTSPEENAIWIRHRAVADGKLYWTEWQPLFNLVIHVNSSGAWNSFSRLVDAVNYANKIASERFPITVKVEKNIDLYQELGEAGFISSISNGNRNGLSLKPYVNLDGSNGVTITCEVPDDVATATSIPNMSGLEVYGANRITGINLRVKNVRYGIHDETGNNSSFNDMYHIYENCKVYHGGNKDNIWTASGAICCGTSNGFNFEIKNCVLESKDYVGFTLHNNDKQTRGKLVIDGLKLTGGFDYDGAGKRSMKIAYYQNAKEGSCQVILKNIKSDNPIVVRKESSSVPSTNAYEIINYSNIDVDIR